MTAEHGTRVQAAEYEHDATAREIARETGADWNAYAAERGWRGVGIGPVGRHRDSDAIARSNWGVVYADLTARFGDAVSVASFGHWAVGWVEEMTHDTGRADVVAAVTEWRERLADYPLADEDAYSETLWSDNHPAGERICYCIADGDGTDCGCGGRYADAPCGCGRPSAYPAEWRARFGRSGPGVIAAIGEVSA